MPRHEILEAVLEERYEYLEELKKSKEFIDRRIKELENEVDDLVIKILESDPQ